MKVFPRIGDQAVIIPIISEIENPSIVGPSQNDGMPGLGTIARSNCPRFLKTDLLLNKKEVQWQLVRLVNLISDGPAS